jgi:hypothetical protein
MSNTNNPLTFNQLLQNCGILLTDVKYYCHTVLDRGNASNYELFTTDPEAFNDYQSTQAGNKNHINRPYLASFVRTPIGDAVFAGFYKVLSCHKEPEENRYKYELEKLDVLSEWCGRLFVEFPKERCFCRCPEALVCGLPIVQLSKQGQSLEFPGFHNFIWSIFKLNTMPDTN